MQHRMMLDLGRNNMVSLAAVRFIRGLDRPVVRLGSACCKINILRARAAELPFVYLGYWVKGSPRMAYKTRYQPLEALTVRGWSPFSGESPTPIAPPPVETAIEAGEA